MKSFSRKIAALVILTAISCSGLLGCLGPSQAAAETTSLVATSTSAIAADASLSYEYSQADLKASTANDADTTIRWNGASASVVGNGAKISGSTVTITAAGTYLLQGSSSQGQLIISAGEKDKVRLIFDGLSLTNSKGPALLAIQADKTIITLAPESKNSLQDGASYTAANSSAGYDAALLSQNDLTINGTGSLTVKGNYQHGICSKDDLVLISGTYNITAAKDSLRGRDALVVKDGNYTLTAGSDGMMANNDEDSAKGWLLIQGGTFQITATGDAVQAISKLQIDGGTIEIAKCYEGLESAKIIINGGDITVAASDDALNAASDQIKSDNYIRITGGKLALTSGGDGIDANGSVYISGGTVLVNGPTVQMEGAMDYDQDFVLSGGTLAIAGSNGMVQSPGKNSSQASLTVFYNQSQKAGTLVSLLDESGDSIFAFSPSKSYQAILISTPDLMVGSTYTLQSGGSCSGTNSDGLYSGDCSGGTKLATFTLTELVTRINQDGTAATNQGGIMPHGGGPGGQMRNNVSGQGIMLPPGGKMPPDGKLPPDGGRPPKNGELPPLPPAGN